MLRSIANLYNGRQGKPHVQRLSSFASVYAKSGIALPLIEGPSESNLIFSFLRPLVEAFFCRFSRKENIIFFISTTLVVAIAIFINYRFLLLLLPLVLMFKYVGNLRKRQLDKKFMSEYPSVLLATASNLKAGLSVYAALERATQLLDEDSFTKQEIKQLLEKVTRGVPKEIAVHEFARSIQMPEIRLFRRAFLLVLVHGGKFSRTLERLSEVSRDRDSLIKSANVSTASMRMTANVLLCMAPLLMVLLSVRTKDFWKVLLENDIAFSLGLAGMCIVLTSYSILRKFSDFKP